MTCWSHSSVCDLGTKPSDPRHYQPRAVQGNTFPKEDVKCEGIAFEWGCVRSKFISTLFICVTRTAWVLLPKYCPGICQAVWCAPTQPSRRNISVGIAEFICKIIKMNTAGIFFFPKGEAEFAIRLSKLVPHTMRFKMMYCQCTAVIGPVHHVCSTIDPHCTGRIILLATVRL